MKPRLRPLPKNKKKNFKQFKTPGSKLKYMYQIEIEEIFQKTQLKSPGWPRGPYYEGIECQIG